MATRTSSNSLHQLTTYNGQAIAEEIGEKIKAGQDIAASRLALIKGSLTNGIIDYSLKCVTGPHKNSFIYINLTPEGEILGSDDKEATLYVENANLQPKHCQITCKNGLYTVKDLNSQTGTWYRQGMFEIIPLDDKKEIKIFEETLSFQFGGKLLVTLSDHQRPYQVSVFEVRGPPCSRRVPQEWSQHSCRIGWYGLQLARRC